MNSASRMVIGFTLVGVIAAVVCGNSEAQSSSNSFVDSVANRVLGKGDDTRARTQAFKKFCDIEQSPFANRVLREYGAVFVAAETVKLPDKCIFPNDETTRKFQSGLQTKSSVVGGVLVT